MSLNQRTLFKLAAISSILAGSIFVVIQFIHPDSNFQTIESTQWFVAHILTFLFGLFAILGITAVFAKHINKLNLIDLVGYLVFTLAMVLISSFAFVETFVLPELYKEAPNYVNQVFKIVSESNTGPGQLGTIYQLSGLMFLIGGVITSIGIIRKKIFSKIAGYILLIGILLSPLAAAVVQIGRFSAVIIGIGLISIGISQWRKELQS